ncbi:hypothetical protein [Methanogenium organophilum]|uniref:Uncharacterized protein n=1 Tax=Methanogenium organophilum TaxID=2199 RepID=A0A9X9T8P6_METOG|nr:hypothetical protein [Methanogenium organophilum]WAI02394.1 hypothetical protein OU421_05855 [Methanogenium organophilum]
MAEARRYAVGIQSTRSALVRNSPVISGRAILIADPMKGRINVGALDEIRMALICFHEIFGRGFLTIRIKMFIPDRVKEYVGGIVRFLVLPAKKGYSRRM